MILQSLRELALREGLVDDPSFESKPVRWIIELRRDGRFRQLYDTNTPVAEPEGRKKKPRLEARLMLIPRRQVRSSGVKANFLVDNAKYVLGFGADDATLDPRNAERHAAFVEMLDAAVQQTNSSDAKSVLAFLRSREQRELCRAALMQQGGFADNDLFTFEVDGMLLHKDEDLRRYWTAASSKDESRSMQCLICGEERLPATLHNQIQIRGASTSGVPLVSFNAEAFEKYGWSGNQNAPVCQECMTAYVEGLRRLTRSRYENPRTGRQVSPLSTVLTGDTTAVYWADNVDPLVEGITALRDDPKRIEDLLQSPRQGLPAGVRDATRFYCLVLTGVQGRAVVRRVHTGSVAEVEDNLRRYFESINVDRFDRAEPLPQLRLLKSMVLNGELDRLPPELGTELWLSALFGLPLSRTFLAAVSARNRAERKVTPERAALLQLYFFTHRLSATTGDAINASSDKETDRDMSLNRESKDPPYLLGRLLAVLENVQTTAQGQNLNRTLVDRTFGAASTRPGVVFPQLIQTAQHHLAKASKKTEGRTIYLNKLLGEVIDGLEIDGFRSTLDLEQQGRFALGYYHQRQSFFRPSDSNAGQPATPATDRTAVEETTAV